MSPRRKSRRQPRRGRKPKNRNRHRHGHGQCARAAENEQPAPGESLMTTIYQYFTDKLGAAPADDTLRQLPINSNTSGHPSKSADVSCWPLFGRKRSS
jgi:hypothetical protein